MQKKFILFLAGSILIIIFALTNSAAVLINLFFWQYEISLALVIFISAALGAILAVLFGGVRQFTLSKEIKRITADNQHLTNENDSLQSENKRLKDDNENSRKAIKDLSDENKQLKMENQTLGRNNK